MINATQFQKSEDVIPHKEIIGTFNLCSLVQHTIIHQINAAVDSEYLADLINDETSLLTGTIPKIIASLFKTYVDITAKKIAAKKCTVESIPYNHTKPLATIFHTINKYSTMTKDSGAPSTTVQLIDIGKIEMINGFFCQ